MKQYIIKYDNKYTSLYYTGLIDSYKASNWMRQFNNSVTVFPDLDSVKKLFSEIYKAVDSEYYKNYSIYEYIPPSVGAKVVSEKELHIHNLQYIKDSFALAGSLDGALIQGAIDYIKET